MKRTVILSAAAALLLCVISPAFPGDNEAEKAALRNEITEQTMKVGGAADTFWTGLAIAGVGAAVLVPVSFLFEDKESKEYKMVLISAAGVGMASVICMAWGGIEWILCAGKLDELKKREKDLMLAPYLNPLAGGGIDTGIRVGINL